MDQTDTQHNMAVAEARKLVAMAVAEGLLSRDCPCRACGGRGPIKLHHPDYTRPLFVVPLCQKCHSAVHSGHIADPGTGRVWTQDRRSRPRRMNGWADDSVAAHAALHAVAGVSNVRHPPFMTRDRFLIACTLAGIAGPHDVSGARHRLFECYATAPAWQHHFVEWGMLPPPPPSLFSAGSL